MDEPNNVRKAIIDSLRPEARVSDEAIAAHVEKMIPDLRKATKALLSGTPAHRFDFGTSAASETGVQSKIVLFLCNEPIAAILEGTLEGIEESGKITMQMIEAAQKAQSRRRM